MKSLSSGLAAIVAVTIWGASFPAASVALQSFSPGALACVRFVVSSILIGLIMVHQRESLPPFVTSLQIAMVGFLGIGFTQLCISFGLTFSTSGDAAFIVATSPIFVLIISCFLGSSAIDKNSLLGILIGATGLGMIFFQSGISVGMIGFFAIILASIALAIYTILNPKYLSEDAVFRITPLQFLAIAMWANTLVFVSIWGKQALDQLLLATSVSIFSAGFLAVFSGVIAYWLFSYALSHRHPVATSGTIYLEPPIAIIAAYLWLHEVPHFSAIIGGIIIFYGVWRANRNVESNSRT